MSGSNALSEVGRLISDERFGARLAVIAGPSIGDTAVIDADGEVIAGELPASISESAVTDALVLIDRERPLTLSYDAHDVFIEPIVPPPRLIIFGAVHIAQELAKIAPRLDYRVVISDARPAFTTSERFPTADELLVGWPDAVADRLRLDRRTSVVVLSHDARFEDPLWPIVLPSPVRYIGAMGSKRTASARRERLLAAGFSSETVDRIHGPIGLDIGADSPAEVAVAILGEMIGTRRRPDEELELIGDQRSLARSRTTN